MKTWLAGILATVISGVIVYYVTLPKSSPIDIAGFVVDAETNALVPDALVSLEVNKQSTRQRTAK